MGYQMFFLFFFCFHMLEWSFCESSYRKTILGMLSPVPPFHFCSFIMDGKAEYPALKMQCEWGYCLVSMPIQRGLSTQPHTGVRLSHASKNIHSSQFKLSATADISEWASL